MVGKIRHGVVGWFFFAMVVLFLLLSSLHREASIVGLDAGVCVSSKYFV